MPLNLVASIIPPPSSGLVSVSSQGIPRFWATIWADVLNPSLKPSTRRNHLSALDHLYQAVQNQRGEDCLDGLIAAADGDALEDCLIGFLAQLRNEAAIAKVDKVLIATEN